MIRIDVLIVGGGLQGLLLLDECTASGRSCVLITNSELGNGQTLHSHGLLNTGFGFAGPVLRETRDKLVLPFLRARGIEPYGEWFLIAPDEMQLSDGASTDSLPAGLDPGDFPVRRIRELNFPRRRLIESLSSDHLDRIVSGRVTAVRGVGTIDTVEIALAVSGDKVLFAPAAVIAATGTGTKRFVGSLTDAASQLAKIRHRRVHILCVRGPVGVLPAASLLSLAHGFNLVAHVHGQTITWYSTPFQDQDPNFEEAPDNAEADIDPDVVRDGFRRLEEVFPAIATSHELRFTAYAGFRQDIGETVGTPVCELVVGTANLLMALPSLAVNAWSNAKAAIAIVDAVAPRRVRQADIPGAGAGVHVGRPREDRPDVSWQDWRQMRTAGA